MGTWRVALPMSAGSSFHGRRKPNGIGVPPGLVGHLEPGVAVELLERVDPGVNRRAKSRGYEARQAEIPPGDHGREDRGHDRF